MFPGRLYLTQPLRHRHKNYERPVLDAAAKLLKVVPEIYTIWNFRREALEPVLAAGGEAAVRAAEGELALTQACLSENPKSYSTWHHRKWVTGFRLNTLEHELQLINKVGGWVPVGGGGGGGSGGDWA